MLQPLAHIRDADLAAFRARFVNRDDVYARQWDDGQGWSRVAAPLTDDVLRAHLRGFLTIGFYTPDHNGMTRWACVDFDTQDGVKRAQALQKRLASSDLAALVELSAEGRAHLWLFFAAPTSAAPVRHALLRLVADMSWPAQPGVVEVFPKHDTVEAGGFGALLRGPLGRHRRAGGQIFPLVRYDAAAGRYQRGGLPTLLATPPVEGAALVNLAATLPDAPAAEPEPRRGQAGRADNVKRSPLTEAIYARLTVRQVLAEKGITVNRAGKAVCPFHDDHHPSLQDYGTHFYCFGCGAKGDVITLFQMLHHFPDRWRARDALCDRLGLDPDEIRGAGRTKASVRRGPRVVQLSFWRDLTQSA